MKIKFLTLVSILALAGMIACSTPEVKAPPAPTPVAVTGKGIVAVLPQGAGFVIESADGKKYKVTNPDKLDKKLQKDKAKIEFAGNALSSASGDTIELTSAK